MKNEWIKCSDRLPKYGSRYITLSKIKERGLPILNHIEIAYYYCQGWMLDSSDAIESEESAWEVTHWANLPKPPKK